MRLTRIAATPCMRAASELRGVDVFAGAAHRILADATGPWLTPPLSDRLPAPPALTRLLRALSGRLVVTNPCVAVRLPQDVGAVARAVLRRTLVAMASNGTRDEGAAAHDPAAERPAAGAPRPRLMSAAEVRRAEERRRVEALLAQLPARARAALAPGTAAWGAVALFEPTGLSVRLVAGAPTPPAPEPQPLGAVSPYRLVIALGRGARTCAWDALQGAVEAAPAVSWPPGRAALPWFVVRVLVPDAIAVRGMDAPTLGRWAELTGRAGPSARDRYWFTSTWDRFREPGRFVGHVTPTDVARSRRRSFASAAITPRWDVGETPVTSGVHAFTPAVERGVCVPPGYCLLECVGTLELAIVEA